jgi:hypothetical protein
MEELLVVEETLLEGIGFFDRVFEPGEFNLLHFFMIEVPGKVGFAEARSQVMDADSCGYGDVQAFGEAYHGDLEKFIGKVKGVRGEAFQFRAKEEGCFSAGEVKILQAAVVLVGCSCHDAVALFFQGIEGGAGIIGLLVIAREGKPFIGSQGHVGVDPVCIPVFDDMYILNAEAFTGSKYGAGVVGLVNVFEDDGKVPGAVT